MYFSADKDFNELLGNFREADTHNAKIRPFSEMIELYPITSAKNNIKHDQRISSRLQTIVHKHAKLTDKYRKPNTKEIQDLKREYEE